MERARFVLFIDPDIANPLIDAPQALKQAVDIVADIRQRSRSVAKFFMGGQGHKPPLHSHTR